MTLFIPRRLDTPGLWHSCSCSCRRVSSPEVVIGLSAAHAHAALSLAALPRRYVVDHGNGVIRKLNPSTGALSIHAGVLGSASIVDGAAGTARVGGTVASCIVDPSTGVLYMTQLGKCVIRKVRSGAAGDGCSLCMRCPQAVV